MVELDKLKIREIKELLHDHTLDDQMVQALKQDKRSGVQLLLRQYERIREKQRQKEEQWTRMNAYENQLRQQGYKKIAGADEVGRGPIAGPVVAAAVILPDDFYLPGLDDSKKLSPQMRAEFYQVIVNEAIAYSVAFADQDVIDQINIYQATLQVMRESVRQLDIQPEICLIDGLKVSGLSTEQLAIVGGDHLSVTIAAASIIAKVTRDRWMTEAANTYPEYGFERHAGYGTPEHLQAIAEHSPCPLHRKTFAGVKEWIG
ncbi:ribonuclease HII [Ammoniphilus resinae]|uniref:Ribonuclease HII n=1 Tax=Ammoniphilus resinae TaxID=861532 RepID=A0ABS4GKJ2_9BACL|nr:ribonuclease HII [Ammoniphilus resinae]MBP1930768.1 ribonuclease HII [Ammoniphilus resinae]